jgi:hypothetical protein
VCHLCECGCGSVRSALSPVRQCAEVACVLQKGHSLTYICICVCVFVHGDRMRTEFEIVGVIACVRVCCVHVVGSKTIWIFFIYFVALLILLKWAHRNLSRGGRSVFNIRLIVYIIHE